MNKKGDIATPLLFIVAIVLVGFALFIFVSFDRDYKSNFMEYAEMMNDVNFAENYMKTISALSMREAIDAEKEGRDVNVVFRDDLLKRDLRYTGTGNFFSKIDKGEFELKKLNCGNGARYFLGIKSVEMKIVVESEAGKEKVENSIRRGFDICEVFDDKGEIIEADCALMLGIKDCA